MTSTYPTVVYIISKIDIYKTFLKNIFSRTFFKIISLHFTTGKYGTVVVRHWKEEDVYYVEESAARLNGGRIENIC